MKLLLFGIRSIVNINSTSKRDIKLINDKGIDISNQKQIGELVNKYFVTIAPKIDSKVKKAQKPFKEHLKQFKS